MGNGEETQSNPKLFVEEEEKMAGIGDLAQDATEILKSADPNAKGRITSQDVKLVFDAVKARVKAGEVVSIQGLGNFRLADRKATTARNPKTGETFPVPASKRMKFTASKTLKEELNP